ncbi:MAG: DUF6259 domain-containing protein [Armatimonadota bacterium]
MRLTNGLVAFEFDPRTGSLVQIEDLRTGTAYLSDPGEGRLFRIVVPDDDEWLDRYGDSHQSGTPQMAQHGDTLTIHFPDVRMADGLSSGIDATVRVTLPAGADEALFTLELEHRGSHQICEVFFPWVAGWHGYEGERGTMQIGCQQPFNPFTQLRSNEGWNLIESTRRTVPGWFSMHLPVADISNGRVGLANNYYPTEPNFRLDFLIYDLNERYGDTHPSWAWVHRPFLNSGEQWISAPVGLAPHQGDWHVAAEKMRSWVNTWWHAPALPDSLRTSIGIHNAYFREFSGYQRRPYSALPALAEYGKEHGLDHFCMWDMSLLGLYCRAGSQGLLEDTPERTAELRQALAEARDLGVWVSPLVNLRLVDRTHPFFKEHGEDWAIRSRYGEPVLESYPISRTTARWSNAYNEKTSTRLCQSHPDFQAWALQMVEKQLDLGFTALFIDQPFSEDYCFAPDHGHRKGIPVHVGAVDWTAKAVELAHARVPDSYVIGEEANLWDARHIQLWWDWRWSQQNAELFRYILPRSLQMWTIDPLDHADQVNRAFALGFLLNINIHAVEGCLLDVPDFAARVKQLSDLRHATADITMLATFRDRQGLLAETPDHTTVALYDAGPALGIALGDCAPGATGGGAIQLTLTPEAMGERALTRAVLHRQGGGVEELPLTKSGDNITLETQLVRWEAAVVELR